MTVSTRLIHVTTTDISLALLLGPQLSAIQQAGYEVITASASGPFVPRLEAMGFRHIALKHATRSMAPHRDLAALIELRSIFSALRPDIVHTHNPKPGVYGRIAARTARVPVVVNTQHGLYAVPDDRLFKRWAVYGLERIAAACSDAELVQSPEDLETLARIGVPQAKLQLLGNGVDLTRFQPDSSNPDVRRQVRERLGVAPADLLVGAVGRLVREKGYEELLRAWDVVRSTCPAARLVIVGPEEPDKSDALDAARIEESRREGVLFLGMQDDVVGLYAAMDVYVLASHREGFPRSAMEAAAMGLPLIVTDIRGGRQVVDHGRTGLVVPVGRPDELSRAIIGLLGDPGRRVAMGEAGRRKARAEFDQRPVIETTLAVYERLLNARTAAA